MRSNSAHTKSNTIGTTLMGNHPIPTDRILERRTSGEIIANMIRLSSDPQETARRRAFEAAHLHQLRIESIGFHCNEALEMIALQELEDAQ